MKTQLLTASLLLLSLTARANDSAFSGVSGTPKPMRGEHRQVAMQSEKIVITADPNGYSTDVEFLFRNDGGKTSVSMGFPENSYGDGPEKGKSAFSRFATWVDGVKTKARRVVIDDEEPEIEAYWVKRVDFGPRQTRRVRVSYRSPWGGNTEWGTHRALVYDFTGKNWKGKVERSDLEVRVASPGLWMGLPIWDNGPLSMDFQTVPPKGPVKTAIFRKTWRNWQADGTFLFGLTGVVPFWMQDRAGSGSMTVSSAKMRNARTFRIGEVPAALPQNAELPPAFTRDGIDYIALSHLEYRLLSFADDLKKFRKIEPRVDLKWSAQTGVSTLVAGAKTLSFAPDRPVEGTQARPLLLRGMYDSSLYVPLAAVAKTLGLFYKTDPKNRQFEMTRGTWTG